MLITTFKTKGPGKVDVDKGVNSVVMTVARLSVPGWTADEAKALGEVLVWTAGVP